MKKSIFLFLSVLVFGTLSAKKVKFSVNMTNETVSPNGIHITGDFQAIAGLGADWDPGTATMVQEGTTGIYSIVVNIPAFKKYEYRFINGNLSYEAEFIPEESRVGYNFVDNRWLYVDSLNNDTSFAGAILFSKNAPVGKTLVRFKVDMTYAGAIPSSGVHLGASYQTGTAIRLYSFGNNVYEIINYVTNNSYDYIFFNGNTIASAETVPSACATGGNRSIVVSKDTVLPAFCFSSCAACLGLGLTKNSLSPTSINLFPNPASGEVSIQADLDDYSVMINDLLGKQQLSLSGLNRSGYKLDVSDLKSGIYLVNIINKQGASTTKKLVVN